MYLAPAHHDHPDAYDFEQFLASNLVWSDADFGQGYAWETDVPPRETWVEEVEKLNANLATLEVSQ